jgi:hypothetical protein
MLFINLSTRHDDGDDGHFIDSNHDGNESNSGCHSDDGSDDVMVVMVRYVHAYSSFLFPGFI